MRGLRLWLLSFMAEQWIYSYTKKTKIYKLTTPPLLVYYQPVFGFIPALFTLLSIILFCYCKLLLFIIPKWRGTGEEKICPKLTFSKSNCELKHAIGTAVLYHNLQKHPKYVPAAWSGRQNSQPSLMHKAVCGG